MCAVWKSGVHLHSGCEVMLLTTCMYITCIYTLGGGGGEDVTALPHTQSVDAHHSSIPHTYMCLLH